jgi:hypothetical protein
MAAVWSNIGRAAAGGPTGKDVPKDEEFFDVSGWLELSRRGGWRL